VRVFVLYEAACPLDALVGSDHAETTVVDDEDSGLLADDLDLDTTAMLSHRCHYPFAVFHLTPPFDRIVLDGICKPRSSLHSRSRAMAQDTLVDGSFSRVEQRISYYDPGLACGQSLFLVVDLLRDGFGHDVLALSREDPRARVRRTLRRWHKSARL
jgi:hypothetical protein